MTAMAGAKIVEEAALASSRNKVDNDDDRCEESETKPRTIGSSHEDVGDKNKSNESDNDIDNDIDNDNDNDNEIDRYRIALYYIYIELTPSQVRAHIEEQRSFCREHGLGGRIRVSTEGVNGVLSGRHDALRAYESAMSEALGRMGIAGSKCESESFNERGNENCSPRDGPKTTKMKTTTTTATATTTTAIDALDTNEPPPMIDECDGEMPADASDAEADAAVDMDVKYCLLRKDLPLRAQLFDRLMVKETKKVIGLFDDSLCGQHPEPQKRRSKAERYRRRRERKRAEQEARRKTTEPTELDSTDKPATRSRSGLGSSESPALPRKEANAGGDHDSLGEQQWQHRHEQQQRGDDAAPPHQQQQQQQQKEQHQQPQLKPLDLAALRRTVMEEPLDPEGGHLSPFEWNEKLDALALSSSSDNDNVNVNVNSKKQSALLLDVRNVYEMKVGHFAHHSAPTLLTNTRKYSDLPRMLAENKDIREKDQIFMYCTGGVRCERVSMLVRELYPDKQVFQLKGGIQRYLETCAEQQQQQKQQQQKQQEKNQQRSNNPGGSDSDAAAKANPGYFVGKNFVFDPRRTDPIHFGETVGRCMVCAKPHDDYDNGHAPSENREARCNNCRMLVLICNECRPKYRCHGEGRNDNDNGETIPADPKGSSCGSSRPLLYCNLDKCTHEGSFPEPELRTFAKKS